MVYEHVFIILMSVSAAFGAAFNPDYFRCHRDLCKRGEQYCVEERQRCYHCADSVHLCNTTELTRDCDSYCYRVQLQKMVELEANKSTELAERQEDLQQEQQKNAVLKEIAKQLASNISGLTKLNENLNAEITKGENLETEHKEEIKEDSRSDLVPLIDRCTNFPTVSPGLTINGDVTVSRLEVQSPDVNIDNDINNTPPPVYQSRLEAKKDGIDITVADQNDINKRANEGTPSVLKNIQPTDSYSGNMSR